MKTVLTFEAMLGPDSDAIPSTSKRPAWCPITRPLRALGGEALKSIVRDAQPGSHHMPVHVDQVSHLVGGHEISGSVTVSLHCELESDTVLTVDAEVADKAGDRTAISKSKIAYLEPAVMSKKPRSVESVKTKAADQSGLVFSARDIERYCDISGDDNPIHTDQEFAQEHGLSSVTVPGAVLLQAAEDQLHKAGIVNLSTRLEVQFADIVYPDEFLSINTRSVRTEKGNVIRFMLMRDDRRIALIGAALEPT